MVAGGLVLVLVAAGAIWFLLRPKPAPPVPPATAARQALESLRQQPETGAILSRVSQVVRLYFGAAFGLPPGEHTTAEFCNSLNAAQEPGQESEIAAFCDATYGVRFLMFAKIDVNGENAHPLYKLLKHEAPGLLGSEAIKWNFTKFLVGRDGKVLKRYAPTDTPQSIEKDIEAAL